MQNVYSLTGCMFTATGTISTIFVFVIVVSLKIIDSCLTILDSSTPTQKIYPSNMETEDKGWITMAED